MKSTHMMLFAVLMALMVNCKKNDDRVIIKPEDLQKTIDLKIYENSMVLVPEDSDHFVVTIDSGNNLVFEYFLVIPSDPNLADSGFTEKILFEIEPLLTDFSISDTELKSIRPYYRRGCYCPYTKSVEITNGKISGTKIGQSIWNVEINTHIILTQGGDSIRKQISGNFYLD